MLESAASGIVVNLLSSALARLGSMGFQRISRVTGIDSYLKGGLLDNKAVRAAVHDFQIVIGSSYGPYTQELDRFMKELEKTGLITSIAELATLKRREPNLEQRFRELHEQFFQPSQGKSERLFEALYHTFEASLHEQISDKALAFYITSVDRFLHKRLDAIERAVESSSSTVSRTDQRAALLKICKGLYAGFRRPS
jgi:hypothetical protein